MEIISLHFGVKGDRYFILHVSCPDLKQAYVAVLVVEENNDVLHLLFFDFFLYR